MSAVLEASGKEPGFVIRVYQIIVRWPYSLSKRYFSRSTQHRSDHQRTKQGSRRSPIAIPGSLRCSPHTPDWRLSAAEWRGQPPECVAPGQRGTVTARECLYDWNVNSADQLNCKFCKKKREKTKTVNSNRTNIRICYKKHVLVHVLGRSLRLPLKLLFISKKRSFCRNYGCWRKLQMV